MSDWRCTRYKLFPLHRCIRTSSIGMTKYRQKRKLTSLWSALIKEKNYKLVKAFIIQSCYLPLDLIHTTIQNGVTAQPHGAVFSNTERDSHLNDDDDNSTWSSWVKKVGFDWSLKKEGLELCTNLLIQILPPPPHLRLSPFAIHHCTVGKSLFALQSLFNNL